MEEHPANPPPFRFPWIVLARGMVAVALIALVLYRSDRQQTWEALRRIDLIALGKAMLLYGALQILSAVKWGLILRSQSGMSHVRVPYPSLIVYYYMGMFANLFFPSSVGGDVLRTVMVSHFAGGLGKGALSILMERVTGFVAMITIGLVATMVLIHGGDHAAQSASIDLTTALGAVILLIGACACLVFFATTILFRRFVLMERLPHWTPARLRRLLRDFAECLENFGRNSDLLLAIFGISFVFQLGFVYLTALMMQASGIDLSFLYLCYFHPVLSTISFLPLTPNALGVREVSVTTLLASQGVPNHLSLLFCFSTYVVMTTLSLPGALAIFFLKPDLRAIARRGKTSSGVPSS